MHRRGERIVLQQADRVDSQVLNAIVLGIEIGCRLGGGWTDEQLRLHTVLEEGITVLGAHEVPEISLSQAEAVIATKALRDAVRHPNGVGSRGMLRDPGARAGIAEFGISPHQIQDHVRQMAKFAEVA